MKKSQIAAGAAIAAVYVVAAQLSFRGGLVPSRPLYDGTGPPPPYNWVKPPPDLAANNKQPSSGTGTTPIGPKHTPAYNVNTEDGQASVIFPPDGIVPIAGQTSVKVVIKPLDPATVASPPSGLDYDGNAYSVTATYQPSGNPIQIPNVVCSLTNANACATVVLRYAFNATQLYRLDGKTWTLVPSQRATSALQIYGNTNKLGVFAAAGPHVASKKPKSQIGNIIAFAVGLVAILLGTFLARVRASRKRRAREAAKGSKGSKAALKQAPPKQASSKQPTPKPQKERKKDRQRRKEEEQKPWWRD